MPEFTITAPDGKSYTVAGPPGSTQEQALQKAMEQHARASGDYQVSQAGRRLEFAQKLGEQFPQEFPGAAQIDPYASQRGPAVPADKANFGASFKAGVIADPETQRREIAKSLFPDDPNGAQRIGFMEGAPVYVDEHGQLKRVSPGIIGGLAETTANVPEAVGAVVGSFATGNPISGAAVGGAGGRAAKRAVSEVLFDEPASPASVGKEMLTEGAINLAAAGIGKGIAGFAGRGKIVDFSPQNVRTAEQARQYVKQSTGIDLDLAQASGDRKLLALRDYAARYPGRTAELIQAADEAAAGQLDNATNRVLDSIAKSTPSEIAGKNGINAAKMVIDAATAIRDKAVAPYYEAARTVTLGADVVADISADPLVSRAAKRVAKDPVYQRKLKDLPENSVGYWHQVKRNLDAGYSTAKTSGDKTAASEYVDAAKQLNKKLGDASAEYARANELYAKATKETIEPLQSSLIGVLSEIKDPVASRAAVKIFSDPNVTPAAINLAKTALEKESPEAYAGLVRQYLAHRWNQALKTTQGGDVINPAGKFRQSVYGTPADRDRMRAMLPAGAASAFDDLMLAMEKLSRTPLGASRVAGSNTFRDQELNEALKGQGAIVFRYLTSPRKSIQDAAEERAKQQSIGAITEALLDPAKRSQLRQVAHMQPSTKQAILLSGILSGQAVADIAPEEIPGLQ